MKVGGFFRPKSDDFTLAEACAAEARRGQRFGRGLKGLPLDVYVGSREVQGRWGEQWEVLDA